MKKNSFPNWLKKKMSQKKKIILYKNFFTSSLDILTYVKILVKIFNYKLFGVYNLGSKNSLSKLDFALKFSKKINKKLNYLSLSASNNKTFKRNLNIGMNVQKIEKKLGLKIINSNQVINNLIKNASSGN